ncbi:MAG: alanyl-tRNA editing protein [Actinomycetota bacterium]|nr:alanyl-tRNA editing protein [Actinomycetota bacterium]
MGDYLCHSEPNLVEFEATVVETRPGAVVLSRSALHPGGGGQVCDRASLEHRHGAAVICDVVKEGDVWWHVLDTPEEVADAVVVRIDRDHRARVAQLHTATHILNAFVFQRFDGALVTGAQIYGDGTARMDFDLPGAQSEDLRSIEHDINDVIRGGPDVRSIYMAAEAAAAIPGMIRSRSVAPPPTSDGRLRTIEILELDQQACGGTHIANTAMSPPVRIAKIDNKGRHNRRIRLALVEQPVGASEVRFV